ncbi:MAG: hypothetical protein IJ550_02110 [Bacteroidaceae bacterium]|nr:hypothetical protein [Bacteroidaceae bacterium]
MEMKEVMSYCMDRYDYPQFFDINIGKDFKLETKPDYNAEVREPRRVVIKISTYRGVSSGAIHYYAKIEADGIKICSNVIERNGQIRKIYHGGYICDEYNNLPRRQKAIWGSSYEIEVGRILTQEEINSAPLRWEYYEAGFLTNAFYSKREAVERAKEIVAARFSKEWVVEIEDNA